MDSKSLWKAIQHPHRTDNKLIADLVKEVHEALLGEEQNLDIIWVSSHCRLTDNDHADEQAKQGMELPAKQHMKILIEFSACKNRIKTKMKPLNVDVPRSTGNYLSYNFAKKGKYTL